MNEIILNKKISVERCIHQIETYYALPGDKPFADDYLKQDAIAMNLQRVSELCVDMANYLVRKKKLGLPQTSADAFVLLHQAGLIDAGLLGSMKAMIGFRNVLIHQYRQLDLSVMQAVVEHRLHEPLAFANLALRVVD